MQLQLWFSGLVAQHFCFLRSETYSVVRNHREVSLSQIKVEHVLTVSAHKSKTTMPEVTILLKYCA